MARFCVRTDLHVEEVGDRVLVLDSRTLEVLELGGAEREAFDLVRRGADVPVRLEVGLAALVELGLVEAEGWDRRRVLLVGGAAAAAAVVAVALPTPAAAQSAPGGGGPGSGGPGGPTVPEQPKLFSAEYIPGNGFEFRLTFADGFDGGSPITAHRVYVDNVAQPDIPGGQQVIAYTFYSTNVQVAAVNAIGVGPRSNAVTTVGSP